MSQAPVYLDDEPMPGFGAVSKPRAALKAPAPVPKAQPTATLIGGGKTPAPSAAPVQHILDREADAERRDPVKVRARLLEGVRYWTEIANRHPHPGASLSCGPVPVLEVRFDLKGRVAGMYCFSSSNPAPYYRINEDLLRRYPVEMIQQTLPHEVAHAVVRHRNGDQAKQHGAEWQAVMREFGKVPERCHRMTVTHTRGGPRLPFTCNCPGRVYQLVVAKAAVYDRLACPKCKHYLLSQADVAAGQKPRPKGPRRRRVHRGHDGQPERLKNGVIIYEIDDDD